MSSSGRPQDVWKSSQSAASRTPARRASKGKGRWFAAAFIAVALGGAIAGLLFYLWPDAKPILLAIPVTDYDRRDWPPNVWADADARGLLDRSPQDGAQTFQAQEKQAILRELDRAAGEASKRPLVVYLSALGIAIGGQVYLVPGDAQPDDPGTWLTLDEVLARVRRAGSSRLLILDIRPSNEPRSIVTGEDVNEVLDATLAKLAENGDLPFFVLTANTPPEGANVLRAVKRTAFGLALAQGASGSADGWNPDRKRDGRVSARELAAYARELTHHIAATAGFPLQLPRLHGGGSDFDLFRVAHEGPPPLPALAEVEPYPDWLQAAWTDREKWFAEDLHRRAPRVTRQLALTATRAERRWLSGGNLEAIKGAFDVPTSRLREIRPSLAAVNQPIGSVARVQRKPGVSFQAASDALRPVFNRILESPGVERDKALLEAMKLIWDKPPDTEPFDSLAAAVVAFTRHNLEQPTHDQMKQLATLLAGLKPRPPRHAELLTLSLIGGLTPEQVARWPEGTIAKLLRVAREAEEAVAIDGRCLPWIRQTLTGADTARRNGLRDLSNPKSTNAVREAAVASIEAAGADYQSVRAAAGALASAFREYEETRAVLVDLAVAYPYNALPTPEVLATAWDVLADDFGKVQQLLRAPTEPGLPNIGDLERAGQSLRAGREQLRAALKVPESAGSRQYERLLVWPHWSPEERVRLVSRLVEAERAEVRKVLDSWPKEQPNRELGNPQPGGNARSAGAVRDLRRVIAMLRLIESPGAGDLKAEFDSLGANPPVKAIDELARKVRTASRRGLARMYVEADASRQALIGWAVDLDDVPAYPQPGNAGPPNPELGERMNSERMFHTWLAAQRYTQDWTVLSASEVAGVRAAANGYREIARAYGDAFR